ncbi:MFS transporter [Nocardia sp. NEAU-G5]|uniref:MFS transporter n=1 Tax=Nocardia albiluteola TaxID=2842303 RepID=A0ABS6AUN4_9NOCA|nr:MFS transporter [Nocardia albiluteola]MBU3061732.1 MFS transporter [Nocardia albiluteola]
MVASTLAPPIRMARASVFAVFGLNGFLCAMWVVHIPAISQRTGTSHATLGMLILLMALGGIAGMQAAGPLADRFGSRTLVAAAGCWVSLAVLGPALATGPLALALALLAFGVGNGALDVSMNAQAVQVERAYPRPIMSAFHALFSCGGLAGSLVGAAAMHRGWDVRATMAAAGVLGLVVIGLCVPRLLPRIDALPAVADSIGGEIVAEQTGERVTTPESAGSAVDARPTRATAQAESAQPPARAPRESAHRKVFALAAIAFAFLMTEGVANDWSALQVREHLGVSDATAALAFGAFSTTMTAGRFTADRVSGRFGRVAVVRWGALLAAAGLILIIISTWLPVTLVGWALLGVGLSGGIPQIFSAAGNLGTAAAATDMSRVFGLGYLGFLAGPSVIGWLSKLGSLTAALAFPLVLILVCAVFARIVRPNY